MSRPSILMICYQYAPSADGGAERQAQRLAEELASRGYEVAVATTRAPGVVHRERLAGVDVRRVWTIWKPGWVSATFLPSLALFLLQHGRRYDIWHVHQAYYHALVALWVARLFGKQCVVKGAASGPFGDIARLRVSKFGGLVLRALRSAHAVVSLNRELSGELAGAGVEVGRARVIPNGVDLKAFAPPTAGERADARRSLGVAGDEVVVVFVGRLARPKGVHTLMDAWRMIEDGGEQSGCRLLLVGDGDERVGLERRSHSELHRVTLLGRLSDVRTVLRAADIMVLPSLSEGLSNAVLEAMAMAVPIVGTDIGGLAEQVEDGVTGVLVPAGDAGSLARGLARLIADPELRRRMGAQGRAVVERGFPLSGTVDAYQQLYQDLVR